MHNNTTQNYRIAVHTNRTQRKKRTITSPQLCLHVCSDVFVHVMFSMRWYVFAAFRPQLISTLAVFLLPPSSAHRVLYHSDKYLILHPSKTLLKRKPMHLRPTPDSTERKKKLLHPLYLTFLNLVPCFNPCTRKNCRLQKEPVDYVYGLCDNVRTVSTVQRVTYAATPLMHMSAKCQRLEIWRLHIFCCMRPVSLKMLLPFWGWSGNDLVWGAEEALLVYEVIDPVHDR